MDINAGLLNEGIDMQTLGAKVFKEMSLGIYWGEDVLTNKIVLLRIGVASGQKSKGELAGISQVSIWRNWFLDDSKQLSDLEVDLQVVDFFDHLDLLSYHTQSGGRLSSTLSRRICKDLL